MDWAKAIEINQAALARIVAALFAMLGIENGGVPARLPQAVYLAALRILRPAESAVRRLIVIAARGVVVAPSPVRPMPKGLAITRKRVSFQLFDSRHPFNIGPPGARFAKSGPRIHFFFNDSPLVPLFQPRAVVEPEPDPKPESDGGMQRLVRRLAAIKMALDDLPRQARRLKRAQARRDHKPSLRFISPLRPGPPPGHRKKPSQDIDWVLTECHALARDALAGNTS